MGAAVVVVWFTTATHRSRPVMGPRFLHSCAVARASNVSLLVKHACQHEAHKHGLQLSRRSPRAIATHAVAPHATYACSRLPRTMANSNPMATTSTSTHASGCGGAWGARHGCFGGFLCRVGWIFNLAVWLAGLRSTVPGVVEVRFALFYQSRAHPCGD